MYQGFISYSHKDEAISKRLHKALEAYRIPKRFHGQPGRGEVIGKRLGKFFRDRDELPTSANLGEQIEQALSDSAYMIVLCSPAAAQSRWVNQEIQQFRQLGRADRIFAVIVSGEPNASDIPGREDEECFPPALRFEVDASGELSDRRTEPIAADLRPERDGLDNTKLKLVAGILGVGFDDLKQRELHAARQRVRVYQAIAGSMILLAVLSIAGGIGSLSLLRESQHQQSRNLAASAMEAYQNDRPARAILLSLEGLPGVQGALLPRPRTIHPLIALAAVVDRPQVQLVLQGHESHVISAQFSPDGTKIVTASLDNTALIWDLQTGAQIVLRGDGVSIRTAQFSPDGTKIVTASQDFTARIWDVQLGIELVVLEGHEGFVVSAQFSPDGTRIVTAAVDRTARLWDAETGDLIVELPGDNALVRSAQFSPDGTRIVTNSLGGKARLWDGLSGELIAILDVGEGIIVSAEFSPDGRQILTASTDGTVSVWDVVTGASLIEMSERLEPNIESALFSPDGTRIVTASRDGPIQIWDVVSGTEIAVLTGSNEIVTPAQFSPDGTRIIAAFDDHAARIWDLRLGAEVAVLREHQARIYSAQFSLDGTQIVTTSADGTARTWNASNPNASDLIERACATLNDYNQVLTPAESANAGLRWRPESPCDRVGVLHTRWWAEAWSDLW